MRAGMAPRAIDYPWSSARAHVECRDPAGLLDVTLWKQLCPLGDWPDVLEQPEAARKKVNNCERRRERVGHGAGGNSSKGWSARTPLCGFRSPTN